MGTIAEINNIAFANISEFNNVSKTSLNKFCGIGIPEEDPIEVATVLLIHSDDADGSTTFVDSSTSAHTITINDPDVHHEVNQKKFCASSIYFDGVSGSYLRCADHDDWNFGTGNFTIDLHVRYTTLAGFRGLISNYTNGYNFWRLYNSSTRLYWEAYVASSDISLLNPEWSPSINTWYHIALVRYGNIFSLYVNGSLLAAGEFNATMPDLTGVLAIGTDIDSGSILSGYMDEPRIVKGIAVWTSNFTPPTAPYYYTCS